MTETTFGERFKAAMAKAGYNGAELARKIGLGKVRVYELMASPEVPPAIRAIADAAIVLDESLDWIVNAKSALDDWVRQNQILIRNLKALTPEQLETVAETVAVLAARNLDKAKHGLGS